MTTSTNHRRVMFERFPALVSGLLLVSIVIHLLSASTVLAQSAERSQGLVLQARPLSETGSDRSPLLERIDGNVQHKWSGLRELDVRLSDSPSTNTLTWHGMLEVRQAGSYKLQLYSQGSVTLRLRDEVVLKGSSEQAQWFASDELTLPFGYHVIELTHESTRRGAGQVALFWQGPGFQLEPISQRYLSHSATQSPGDIVERGRLLAHGLRCASCHTGAAVPEPLPAASLTRLSGNLEREWFERWLQSNDSSALISKDLISADDELRDDEVPRRMPHLGLTARDAADIAEALYSQSEQLSDTNPPRSKGRSASEKASDKAVDNKNGKSKEKPRTEPSATQGKQLFATRGCIACHDLRSAKIGLRDEESDNNYQPINRMDHLAVQLFGGGDLSHVGHKRPKHFFARWLAEPQRINSSHRMPLADLTELERDDLSLYLASELSPQTPASPDVKTTNAKTTDANTTNVNTTDAKGPDAKRGLQLIHVHRCGACHQLPEQLKMPSVTRTSLSNSSDWQTGCLDRPSADKHRPGYGLTKNQRDALKRFWTSYQTKANSPTIESQPGTQANSRVDAELLLVERNCTACHARGVGQGISIRATDLAIKGTQPQLSERLPALLPPSLTGVGDKLHDKALRAAIERKEEPRRPWLDVRMPKYEFESHILDQLATHLINSDRIPDRSDQTITPLADDVVTRAAAGRLVTSEGFGCQSCHQIGRQVSPTVALGARGTNLTMLGDRIRHSWFDRWVRNPVRIVPRMEMPAIQLPVHGVLGNDLKHQIDAVWEMLNTPGFQPPTPAPVRIVRGHNQPGSHEAAQVLTDVLETPGRNFLRPLIVGFENRHNLLFDLERGDFARWWIGDTARELTRGKSWYWELGGQPLAAPSESLLTLSLIDNAGQVWRAQAIEQFAVEFDQLTHTTSGIQWQGRMHFAHDTLRRVVPITMSIEPQAQSPVPSNTAASSSPSSASPSSSPTTGLRVTLSTTLDEGFRFALDLDPLVGALTETTHNASSQSVRAAIDIRSALTLTSEKSQVVKDSERRVLIAAEKGQPTQFELRLETSWPVDQVALDTNRLSPASALVDTATITTSKSEPAQQGNVAQSLTVVPGFEALRLPLPRSEMPTALGWYQSQLVIGSLKGRVCIARDRNADGLADDWEAISDDLPAPYGLAVHDQGIDVLVKFGLVRLTKPKREGVPWDMQVIADGWGHTTDYHDWAVGLPRDSDGNYYVALPCQQDDRSPSAARLRGTIQKLLPQSPTSQNPRLYRLETVAAGQRFPMGLAFDLRGNLFATDNQGNYNPFNEINHIRSGKRYGFINKLENKPGFNPPLESPAVNLPHPWTRSVNGICFLNTPATAKQKQMYGPFEGHMIGCEYNYLSLIRMSFEEVDGVMQGAAYLFSRPPREGEPTFEGPVVCQLDPDGNLIVGNIHDSGWGGGQNTGSIVRITPSGQWPLGIRTVTAMKNGLAVEFTGQVDRELAAKPVNYSLRSYRRVSTPAYGGNDQDEREEKILLARVLPGESRVELELSDLRADCVYELRVGPVAGEEKDLFPNEAHYTMKRTPK